MPRAGGGNLLWGNLQGPLNGELLSKIDIVAGTMTTLVYELLPAGKIIWYLDTPYRHLQDLVEEGLAHRIRLEDIQPLGHMPTDLTTPTVASAEGFFGSETVEETLRKYLNGALAASDVR
jgi:hypothetical protein